MDGSKAVKIHLCTMLKQMNNPSEWIKQGDEAMAGQLCHKRDLQHLKETWKKNTEIKRPLNKKAIRASWCSRRTRNVMETQLKRHLTNTLADDILLSPFFYRHAPCVAPYLKSLYGLMSHLCMLNYHNYVTRFFWFHLFYIFKNSRCCWWGEMHLTVWTQRPHLI